MNSSQFFQWKQSLLGSNLSSPLLYSKIRQVGAPLDNHHPEPGFDSNLEVFISGYSDRLHALKLELANAQQSDRVHSVLKSMVGEQRRYERTMDALLQAPYHQVVEANPGTRIEVKISDWITTAETKECFIKAGVWKKTWSEIVSAQEKILNFWNLLGSDLNQDALVKEAERVARIEEMLK